MKEKKIFINNEIGLVFDFATCLSKTKIISHLMVNAQYFNQLAPQFFQDSSIYSDFYGFMMNIYQNGTQYFNYFNPDKGKNYIKQSIMFYADQTIQQANALLSLITEQTPIAIQLKTVLEATITDINTIIENINQSLISY